MTVRAEKLQSDSVPLPGVRKVIAIGASAGGLHPLLEVLAVLPASLPCVVLVATHLPERKKSMMPELIARICPLRVIPASDTPLQASTVYVARPGCHLTVSGKDIRLLDTPPVRFLRPNVDILFESVASTFGDHAVGVILSGMGRDGAEGLKAIKQRGGMTIVEDPASAEFPEMPRAALRTDCIDWVLSSDRIGELLINLCTESSPVRNG